MASYDASGHPSHQCQTYLLIGTNVPKAMELEEVTKSVNDNAVKIPVLGWTVNRLLREGNHEETRGEVTYARISHFMNIILHC